MIEREGVSESRYSSADLRYKAQRDALINHRPASDEQIDDAQKFAELSERVKELVQTTLQSSKGLLNNQRSIAELLAIEEAEETAASKNEHKQILNSYLESYKAVAKSVAELSEVLKTFLDQNQIETGQLPKTLEELNTLKQVLPDSEQLSRSDLTDIIQIIQDVSQSKEDPFGQIRAFSEYILNVAAPERLSLRQLARNLVGEGGLLDQHMTEQQSRRDQLLEASPEVLLGKYLDRVFDESGSLARALNVSGQDKEKENELLDLKLKLEGLISSNSELKDDLRVFINEDPFLTPSQRVFVGIDLGLYAGSKQAIINARSDIPARDQVILKAHFGLLEEKIEVFLARELKQASSTSSLTQQDLFYIAQELGLDLFAHAGQDLLQNDMMIRAQALEGLGLPQTVVNELASRTEAAGVAAFNVADRVDTLAAKLEKDIAAAIVMEYPGVFYISDAQFSAYINRASKLIANPLKRSAVSLELDLSPYSPPSHMRAYEYGATFEDILLEPQKSLPSRSSATTETTLAGNIKMATVFTSANMDTVTEVDMAIAMARFGGIGFIHRALSIDDEVTMVKRVKRAESGVIRHPQSISPIISAQDAREAMDEAGIGGFIVKNDAGRCIGIVTRRDVQYLADSNLLVRDVMTPRDALVVAQEDVSLQEAQLMLQQNRIEKLPLVNDKDEVVGLITGKDIRKRADYPQATRDEEGRLRVGAAVGVGDDALERARALMEAEADVLVVDIANGYSERAVQVLEGIAELKEEFSLHGKAGADVAVVAGNVATREAAEALAPLCDAIKVGIGPGGTCTTRIVTGHGVPQIRAIMDVRRGIIESGVEAKGRKVAIIADGGIREPGAVVKALSAGADTVMLGTLLAGADESPAEHRLHRGKEVKVLRGMSSQTAGKRLSSVGKNGTGRPKAVTPEGIEDFVPLSGSVEKTLSPYQGGLQSGMSYNTAFTIEELRGCEMIIVSPAARRESEPHANT